MLANPGFVKCFDAEKTLADLGLSYFKQRRNSGNFRFFLWRISGDSSHVFASLFFAVTLVLQKKLLSFMNQFLVGGFQIMGKS